MSVIRSGREEGWVRHFEHLFMIFLERMFKVN